MKIFLILEFWTLLSGSAVTTKNQSLPQPHAWTASHAATTAAGSQSDSFWLDVYRW